MRVAAPLPKFELACGTRRAAAAPATRRHQPQRPLPSAGAVEERTRQLEGMKKAVLERDVKGNGHAGAEGGGAGAVGRQLQPACMLVVRGAWAARPGLSTAQLPPRSAAAAAGHAVQECVEGPVPLQRQQGRRGGLGPRRRGGAVAGGELHACDACLACMLLASLHGFVQRSPLVTVMCSTASGRLRPSWAQR